jgi:ribosomal protein S6
MVIPTPNKTNMSDVTMPTTEAASTNEQEFVAYELAYHVLPTVAEGEVAGVTAALTAFITQAGGTITSQEAAERFELAYEISKYLEGKYRRFSSAYFGWVRFSLPAAAVPALTADVEAHKSILRSLVIRLSKTEEQQPFNFHEALVDTKFRSVPEEEVLEDEEVPAVQDGDDTVVEEVVK